MKNSLIKNFLKTSLIFFIGNVLTKILSVFLLPLYTSSFSPEIYGEYNFNLTLINLIVPLIFVQIWDSVFRFSFDSKDQAHKSKIITNGTVFFSCIMGLSLLGYMLFTHFLNYENSLLIFLSILTLAVQYLFGVIARCYQKNAIFVISGTINAVIMMFLNVVLIVHFEFGIESLYISTIVGNIIQAIILLFPILMLKAINIKLISLSVMKKLISFSFPLSFSTIAQWLLIGFTQVMISKTLGFHFNGVYTAANKISSILLIFIGVLQFAWNETAYIINSEQNSDSLPIFKNFLTIVFKYGLTATAIMILVSKIIFPFLINDTYNEAIPLLPITILSTGITALNGFIGTIFIANKNVKIIFISTLVAGIVNFALQLIFTKNYGLLFSLLFLTISLLISIFLRLIKSYKIGILNVRGIIFGVMITTFSFIIFYISNNMFYNLLSLFAFTLIIFIFDFKNIKLFIKGIINR